ncbi:MAG: hypothetical protein M5U34_12035 [Chloroflexi bacterium]|nr:hypothetical protein [Chloroflexota bacterium]
MTLDLPAGITMDEGQVISVTVEIEPILSTAVYNRPIEFQGVGTGLSASAKPEEARVVLFGPLPILDSLTEDEVRVTVDTFGLITGTYSLEPVVTIPDRGLEMRSVQPPLITVDITSTLPNGLTITLPITKSSRLNTGGITAVTIPPTSSTSAPSLSSFILPPSSFINLKQNKL